MAGGMWRSPRPEAGPGACRHLSATPATGTNPSASASAHSDPGHSRLSSVKALGSELTSQPGQGHVPSKDGLCSR